MYLLASLINLLSVFRCGRCVCGCQKTKTRLQFDTQEQLSFFRPSLCTVQYWDCVSVHTRVCIRVHGSTACLRRFPSVCVRLLLISCNQRQDVNMLQQCFWPSKAFYTFSAYLDRVGRWTRQSKSFPALMNLTQRLGCHPHPNYWKRIHFKLKYSFYSQLMNTKLNLVNINIRNKPQCQNHCSKLNLFS